MFEIKVTIDISDRLLSTLSILAGSLHTKAEPVKQEAKPVDMPVYVQKTVKVTENVETAKSDALTKAVEQDAPAEPQNLPVDTPKPADVPKPAETVESHAAVKSEAPAEPKAETPKKASRSKKAEPVKADPVEEKAESEDPLMPPEPTKAPEPVKEEPKADETPKADEGKGATGDVLAELTKRAIVELTEAGIDRADSNRRIREYCAKNEIKYPTFPALLNAVGYSKAIAVCKGEA